MLTVEKIEKLITLIIEHMNDWAHKQPEVPQKISLVLETTEDLKTAIETIDLYYSEELPLLAIASNNLETAKTHKTQLPTLIKKLNILCKREAYYDNKSNKINIRYSNFNLDNVFTNKDLNNSLDTEFKTFCEQFNPKTLKEKVLNGETITLLHWLTKSELTYLTEYLCSFTIPTIIGETIALKKEFDRWLKQEKEIPTLCCFVNIGGFHWVLSQISLDHEREKISVIVHDSLAETSHSKRLIEDLFKFSFYYPSKLRGEYTVELQIKRDFIQPYQNSSGDYALLQWLAILKHQNKNIKYFDQLIASKDDPEELRTMLINILLKNATFLVEDIRECTLPEKETIFQPTKEGYIMTDTYRQGLLQSMKLGGLAKKLEFEDKPEIMERDLTKRSTSPKFTEIGNNVKVFSHNDPKSTHFPENPDESQKFQKK